MLFFDENSLRPVNRRRKSTILFFVRVNQVLVRLWARAMEVEDVVSRVRPVVRLMSDRESVSGVSRPRLGFDGRAHAPKSDSEGSEALCELIRMLLRSPQGMEDDPGSVPKMIEIRR